MITKQVTTSDSVKRVQSFRNSDKKFYSRMQKAAYILGSAMIKRR